MPKGVAEREEHGYKGIGGLQDYASDKGAKGYLIAGILGVGVILGALLLGGRLLVRHESPLNAQTDRDGIEERSDTAGDAVGVLPTWLHHSSEDTSDSDKF